MAIRTYPPGTVSALFKSDHVSPTTATAVRARQAAVDPSAPPRFFTVTEVATLRAVCRRLIPAGDLASPIDPAGIIDARLAAGQSDGWRYDVLPTDGTAYRRALAGLDETATLRHGQGFAPLDPNAQDAILADLQTGQITGERWQALPAARFFEDLLADVCAAFMAHPAAQDAIGYAGMADLPRWEQIGLDELDEREPRAIESDYNRD